MDADLTTLIKIGHIALTIAEVKLDLTPLLELNTIIVNCKQEILRSIITDTNVSNTPIDQLNSNLLKISSNGNPGYVNWRFPVSTFVNNPKGSLGDLTNFHEQVRDQIQNIRNITETLQGDQIRLRNRSLNNGR
jgi:hypothetical protein